MEAHFYNPRNDSLEERAKAYSCIYREWKNLEASFKYHDQLGWKDKLGTKEELQSAKAIIQCTLDKAANSFSHNEIQELANNGLIAEDEFTFLQSSKSNINETNASVINSRKQEASKVRQSNYKSPNLDKDL